MAKENIAFLVNLRKNTAVGTDREGRYYPEAESKEALTTKGFAKHVSEHGGLVTYEFMQLVLASIVKCLKEMMSQGQPVKLDGLGTFRPTVTSVKNGAASIEEALTMGVNNMVAGVNFVFIPENAQGEEITSKKFKEQSRSSARCSSPIWWRPSRRRSTARRSRTRCARRCLPMASSMRKRMPRAVALIAAPTLRAAALTTPRLVITPRAVAVTIRAVAIAPSRQERAIN